MLDWITANKEQLKALFNTFSQKQIADLLHTKPRSKYVPKSLNKSYKIRQSTKKLIIKAHKLRSKGLKRKEMCEKIGCTPAALNSYLHIYTSDGEMKPKFKDYHSNYKKVRGAKYLRKVQIQRASLHTLGKKRTRSLDPKHIITSALPH